MGMVYFVDSKPIFLTFKKYSLVCKMMREMELISIREEFSAESDNKKRTDLEQKIVSFLYSHKEIINDGNFEMEGMETQEEISTLLMAYCRLYGGFEFYQFKTTWSDSSGKFVPFEYADIDVRYPYGKKFYISKASKKGIFKRKTEPSIHISINIEKVVCIKGDLSSFEVNFLNDRKMLFFQNQFCII